MTEAEYLNGNRIEAEECVIVLVANHKQIFQGKARLSIPFWLHDIVEIYRKYIRPENLDDYEFAGRQVTPCIVTRTGKRYTTTSLLSDIESCWIKAGMKSHEFGTEEDKYGNTSDGDANKGTNFAPSPKLKKNCKKNVPYLWN